MSKYFPDRWMIIEMSDGKNKFHKVFSGNYGGYTGSDDWKLSSAITSIIPNKDSFTVHCQSGSIYELYRDRYGMSNYMSSIYHGWETQAANAENVTVRILDEYQG